MMIRDQIQEVVAHAAQTTTDKVNIEHPELDQHGDYSTNIALVLKGGRAMAEDLAKKITDPMIAKVEVAGPGFINIWLKEEYLLANLGGVTDLPKQKLAGQRVVIEYTDPNPFKEFHIGHLISNVTGEALARLLEANGATVRRVDYFGDVGVHVAKSIWGLQKKMREDRLTLPDLAEKPLVDRVKYMGEGYALGARAYEEDEAAKAEMGHLNTVIYLVAQKMWQKEGYEPVINYDPQHTIPEQEVNGIYDLYQTGRKWSLDYFETIYQRLGTKFDGYYPESRVGEAGYKLVMDNIGSVFERSEGAIVFKGEKFGLHTRVFINKHNLPTYEAKELGLAPAKFADSAYDKSIIVVGKEIQDYFKVLVEALTQLNPKLGKATQPLCTGMVNVPGGKMSSRKGNVITVTGLLEDINQQALARMKTPNPGIADKIAVAAIKYAFLKSSIGQDIVFDIQGALSLEGNTGPYLQYTYARIQSILKKSAAGETAVERTTDRTDGQLSTEETALVRFGYRYGEIVADAASRYAPSLLTTYLYELAQRFNTFYNKHTVLGHEFRLSLTKSVGEVLASGLDLLGISALESM